MEVLKQPGTSRILGAMNKPLLAFDRSSVRSFDADGRMHVAVTHISKANICSYYGHEIPGHEELGLDAAKIYRLWRDPAELEKSAPTFRNLPLLRRHIQVSADEPSKDDVVGSIGSDVTFSAPYLDASLCIWDAEAIAGIESEQLEELSSAYRYKAEMVPGETPDGGRYDGRMTDIIGNHLALVEVGRAGSDVAVADHDPFRIAGKAAVAAADSLPADAIVAKHLAEDAAAPQKITPQQETPAMKPTKLGRALMVALSAASTKIAQDSSLGDLVGKSQKKAFKKESVVKALVAMDADIDAEKLDEIIDAILGVEDTPEPTEPTAVADESGGEYGEVMEFLRGKGVGDSDLSEVGSMLAKLKEHAAMDEEEVESKVQTAMDGMRREFRDLESAKSDVRKIVGDVIGMDSAEGVYRFALDHLKVKHKETPAAGLRNLFAVASERSARPSTSVSIASDAAAAAATIPGLDRFS